MEVWQTKENGLAYQRKWSCMPIQPILPPGLAGGPEIKSFDRPDQCKGASTRSGLSKDLVSRPPASQAREERPAWSADLALLPGWLGQSFDRPDRVDAPLHWSGLSKDLVSGPPASPGGRMGWIGMRDHLVWFEGPFSLVCHTSIEAEALGMQYHFIKWVGLVL